MKTGIEAIVEERRQQIEKHGWTPEHDDEHKGGELAIAALFAQTLQERFKQPGFEEFEEKMWMKSQQDRLAVAGALIAAEIDRLNRYETI